jgi:hypothetical protein
MQRREIEKQEFALHEVYAVDVLDEKHARMGVIECAKHDLVEPYPVYQEKDEEFFKFTLLLMPSAQMQITN